MKTIKAETFDALMGTVHDELRKGRVFEAHLVAGEGECLDGVVDGDGAIYIDPGPQIVETVIHEALHRAYPRWGEKRICKTSHLLVMAMSDEERRAWYRRWQRHAKRLKKPVHVEA